MTPSDPIGRFRWLDPISPDRPQFVWENREDAMYHEMALPAPHDAAPEFYAFAGNRIWVFNRAFRWIRREGVLCCHEEGAVLELTGERQVSKWWSAPPNTLEESGLYTVFRKASARCRDAAVLPCIQTSLEQHPVWELEVESADAAWQCVLSVKGRGGPPLLASPWIEGPGRHRFDLRAALRARGYTGQFPELHVAIGVWSEDPARPAALRFRLTARTEPALLASLPVIRTAAEAATSAPVACIALDDQGRPAKSGTAPQATVSGNPVHLESGPDGVWLGFAAGLAVGEHPVHLRWGDAPAREAAAVLRVTAGAFASYDAQAHLVRLPGRKPAPISGSYQGTFFVRDAGTAAERLVQGQADWDRWDRDTAPGEHQIYWDGMFPKEMEQRFAHLQACGWDILHLHQHWGIWGRLDAGGRISPHGAEQLALYAATGARHGLWHMQALSSYEYSVHRTGRTYGGTAPWSAYVEAGFADADWFHPYDTAFDRLFAGYLKDFASIFRSEDALLSISSCGEGDAHCGSERVLEIHRVMSPLCPRHLYVAEPIHNLARLPRGYARNWPQAMFGCRNYCFGRDVATEVEFSVNYKLMALGRLYLAEGNYAASPQYLRLMHHIAGRANGLESWTGTERYRRALRDSLYLALVHRIPLTVFWDECVCEDEHVVFSRAREAVDWLQPWAEPRVVLRVRDENVSEGGERLLLYRYEQALEALGVAWRYGYTDEVLPPGAVSIDPAGGFVPPAWVSEGGQIPDKLRAARTWLPSLGFWTQACASQDGRTLVAYAANTSYHDYLHTYYFMSDLSGRHHRLPRPAALRWRWGKVSPDSRYTVWDLDAKAPALQGRVGDAATLELPASRADYLVVAHP